jgi:Zn-dependent protease
MPATTNRKPGEPIASAAASVPAPTSWPLERILFALAGTMTLLSALLAATISPWFLLLTAFVGINQWLYVRFGNCPASLVLGRLGASLTCRW